MGSEMCIRDRFEIRMNLNELTYGTLRELMEILNLGVARSRLLTSNEGREILSSFLPGLVPMDGSDELISPTGAPPVETPGDAGDDNEG